MAACAVGRECRWGLLMGIAGGLLVAGLLCHCWGVDDEVDTENHFGLWVAVAFLGITLFIGAFWYVVSH